MSVETNKVVVQRWFEAVARGDEAGILALLADDFQFESMVMKPEWMHYRWDRNQFAAAPAGMSQIMKRPIVMTMGEMIGEGDKIAVEATSDGEMKNGKRYNNSYHFAIRVRGDQICEIKEYSCSFLANDCFGEYNPASVKETA